MVGRVRSGFPKSTSRGMSGGNSARASGAREVTIASITKASAANGAGFNARRSTIEATINDQTSALHCHSDFWQGSRTTRNDAAVAKVFRNANLGQLSHLI